MIDESMQNAARRWLRLPDHARWDAQVADVLLVMLYQQIDHRLHWAPDPRSDDAWWSLHDALENAYRAHDARRMARIALDLWRLSLQLSRETFSLSQNI